MRRFKSTPPAITVIALSRLHILALCSILLAILNYPYSRKYETALKLNLPGNKHSTKNGRAFNMDEIKSKWKKEDRQYVNFNLTGDINFDRLTLYAIAYETRKLKFNEDTTHVIKIHFTNQCTYGQFVGVNNIMKTQMQSIYAFEGNDFYIWEMPAD